MYDGGLNDPRPVLVRCSRSGCRTSAGSKAEIDIICYNSGNVTSTRNYIHGSVEVGSLPLYTLQEIQDRCSIVPRSMMGMSSYWMLKPRRSTNICKLYYVKWDRCWWLIRVASIARSCSRLLTMCSEIGRWVRWPPRPPTPPKRQMKPLQLLDKWACHLSLSKPTRW